MMDGFAKPKHVVDTHHLYCRQGNRYGLGMTYTVI